MGFIVPFPEFRPSRPLRGGEEADAVRGAILFFTGVRYSREGEPDNRTDGRPSSSRRSKTRRKRG